MAFATESGLAGFSVLSLVRPLKVCAHIGHQRPDGNDRVAQPCFSAAQGLAPVAHLEVRKEINPGGVGRMGIVQIISYKPNSLAELCWRTLSRRV
jgi:hypothetical protein